MKHVSCLKSFALLLLLVISASLSAQLPANLTLSSFSTGYSSPVDIANCGDSRLFIVQQRGKIIICDTNGFKLPTPFLDLTGVVSTSGSERGLLGLAFDPDYKKNGYFFINYTEAGTGNTVIARYRVNPTDSNLAIPSSGEQLMYITQPYSNHNGGCLRFGPDGYLYIGMGDGGSAGDPGNRSQDPMELLGKMLRIDVKNLGVIMPYNIPATNPFYGSSTTREEIWSIGLRNPWKFSFDRITGDMWMGDVGQNNWEEIDFQPASSPGGENYGWRCYEGFVTYDMSLCGGLGPFTAPVAVYSHSGFVSCSVTGGVVYRGALHKNMFGTYFFTDYCSDKIWATWDTSGAATFDTQEILDYSDSDGFVSFGEDWRGEMYLAGISTGKIYKLLDTTCTPVAHILNKDSSLVCSNSALTALEGAGLSYQWYDTSGAIAGATSWSFSPPADGSYYVIVTSPGGCADTSASVYVTVAVAPVVSLTPIDSFHCSDAGPVLLTASPPGGYFTGPGVTDSLFYPVSAGIGYMTIEYIYTDSAGCTASAYQTVVVDNCVSVNGASGNQTTLLNVFPNPGQQVCNVEIVPALPGAVTMEWYNALGEMIHSHQETATGGKQVFTVSTGSFPSGMYFIRVSGEGHSGMARWIKF